MADKAWKRSEREAARDLGVQRIPVTGERHGADFATATHSYQLKVRRALPTWIFDWLDGICLSAKVAGKSGVLVLNRPRRRRSEALVVVRWADWCDLVGTPQDGSTGELEDGAPTALKSGSR